MDMATNGVHVLDHTGKPIKELYVPDAYLYHSSGIDVDNSGRVFWQVSGESEFEVVETMNLAPVANQQHIYEADTATVNEPCLYPKSDR